MSSFFIYALTKNLAKYNSYTIAKIEKTGREEPFC
jgi:hypothetical protein